MARSFAARGRRGLAVAAPVATLLVLAVPSTAGPLPQLPVNPPVHVQLPPPPSLPHVNVGPTVVQHTVNPVIDRVNNTTSRVNRTISHTSSGTPSGVGGGPQSNGSGGPGGTGNRGGGGGTGRAAGGAGGAAARRATARRVTAAIAGTRGNLGNAIAAAGGAPLNPSSGGPGGVFKPIRDVIRVIPDAVKIVIAGLIALALALILRSFFAERRTRRLESERAELLGDFGLLQRALLANVPDRIGALDTSVDYRPADGPGAGGDFYDVVEMQDGRVGIIVGDVCGHGRDTLELSAFMRYTLRTHLTMGVEPRAALQNAARQLGNDPRAELTTVVLAVYDGAAGSLTYACAGHEPPILVGAPAHDPVTVGSSPPIGVGMETGLRQTTVSLPPGSMAFFFTDGLVEARLGDGLLGRERVSEVARELGPGASAKALLERIAERADRAPDDMAACVIRARDDAKRGDTARIEDLELEGVPGEEERARKFLEACRMPPAAADQLLDQAGTEVAEFGAAVLRVRLDTREGRAEVLPSEPGVVRLEPNDGAIEDQDSLRPITRISA